MKLELNQKRRLNKPIELVYALLSNFDYWSQIHDKLESVEFEDAFASGKLRFRTKLYDFVAERSLAEQEIIYKIVTLDQQAKELNMSIVYELQAKKYQTLVTETVAYEQELPVFVCLVAKYLNRFGRSSGTPSLERLEQLSLVVHPHSLGLELA